MTQYLPHLASRIFGTPLLIQPRKLDVILHVLGPRIGLDHMPEARAEGLVDPSGRKPYAVTENGIAVISVSGSLVRKSGFLSSASGMSNYADIEHEFLDAVTDPAISGILLDIDSPGGEASGVFDLSDQIFSQRGTKPIYAIANDSMYSAAYAIGSAADQVFVTRTGGVGSIGVICLHVDQSQYDAKEGLKYTPIYAGAHKNDLSPHEPLSDEALANAQGEVDRLYDMFVSTVARNRGLAVDNVKSTEALCFWGSDAINTKLADQIGNFGDALRALTGAVAPALADPQPSISLAGTSVAAISKEGEVNLLSNTPQTADNTAAEQGLTNNTGDASALHCTQCKAVLGPDTKFCSQCGTSALANPTATSAKAPLLAGLAATGLSAVPKKDALEIMQLCSLAGKSLSTAIGYMDKNMTVEQVRTDLLSQRVAVSAENETTSAVTGAMGTEHKVDMSNPSNNVMLAWADEQKNKPNTFRGRN